jgi:hypothetical protein
LQIDFRGCHERWGSTAKFNHCEHHDFGPANRTKYRALFEVLPVEIRRIFFEAFCEMESLKPGIYDLWWVVNHNRYIRDFKQRDLILVHEIMYFFLSNYCDGTLKKMAQANAI